MNLSTPITVIILQLMVLLTSHVLALRDSEVLEFFVTEEVRKGTVIASGLALGNVYQENIQDPPRIINQGDPGVSLLALVFESESMNGARNLQLIVADRLDRESICPNAKGTQSTRNGVFPSHSTSDFLIETNQQPGGIYHSISMDSTSTSRTQDKDCKIALRIASTDGHMQSVSQIFVYVQDINDNPPVWEEEAVTIYFKDNDPPGAKQPIPLADDADHKGNALISYRLQEPESAGLQALRHETRVTDMFELIKETDPSNPTDNRLYLVSKQEIDREAHPQGWDLIVVASNVVGTPIRSSKLKVHINITDLNDNTPIFSQSLYQPQLPNQKVGVIPETIAVGETVLTLQASDADEGLNAMITYDFSQGPQSSLIREYFRIDKQGRLQIKQRLQVDSLGPDQAVEVLPTSPITFDVLAVDGADSAYARTGTASIRLQIEDIDDEAPIIRVHPIRPWNGVNGTNEANNQTELAVSENDAVGQLLALVEVTDPDKHGHDVIRCKLEGHVSSLFRLTQTDMTKPEYRLYSAAPLDREKDSHLLLIIECRDLVDHISTHKVGVNVLDDNDNAPRFDLPIYQFSVYEDDGEMETNPFAMSQGRWLTETGQAFVTAGDLDEGVNRELSYHIAKDSDVTVGSLFAIDETTGQLQVIGVLDRETSAKHTFKVLAIDKGSPSKTGTCLVNIMIVDVNDNAPVFSIQQSVGSSYTFSIPENQLPGKKVGQVDAYDLDQLPPATSIRSPGEEYQTQDQAINHSGEQLIYGLRDEPDAKHFWIDPKSGVIITRAILDREKQAVYTFHVTVRDGPIQEAIPSRTPRGRLHEVSIIVTVTVEDENDNDPVFLRPNATNHMVLLDPAAIPGQSLLQILAADPDEGPNGMVSYAIKGGNAGNLFNVDPRTGLVYLENPIPRKTIMEATAAANAAAKHRDGSQNPDFLPVHPTFLLALEACDQGERRRCTHFPNLQIQIRVPSDGVPISNAADLIFSEEPGSAALLLNSEYGTSNTFLSSGYTRGVNQGHLSILEIIIITLSVFFSILLIGVVPAACILRRRAKDFTRRDGTKNTVPYKPDDRTLESSKCSTPVRVCTNMSLLPNKMVVSPANSNHHPKQGGEDDEGTLTRAGIHFNQNHSVPKSLGYLGHPATSYYGTPCYGLQSQTVPPNGYIGTDQYQSLEAWSTRQLGYYPSNPTDLHCLYNPQTELLCLQEKRKNYDEQLPDNPQSDCSQIPQDNPSSVQSSGKTHVRSYSGFPKSSFV